LGLVLLVALLLSSLASPDAVSTRASAYQIDLEPPPAPALLRPRDGASRVKPNPVLRWAPVADAGGIARYELVLDGAAQDSAKVACAEECVQGITVPLARGDHRWSVRAVDNAGNVTESEERSFRVNMRPKAALEGVPDLQLTGDRVTFFASGSIDGFGQPVVQYDWDLDGNGSFETNTGRRSRASTVFRRPGSTRVSVRVTDSAGFADVDSTTVRVRLRSPEGAPGVTINGGEERTSDDAVQLDLRWPLYATRMEIANNRAFRGSTTRSVTPALEWQLQSVKHHRARRTVFVRFEGGEATDETFSDAIVLTP
jgi:hypothetical protein